MAPGAAHRWHQKFSSVQVPAAAADSYATAPGPLQSRSGLPLKAGMVTKTVHQIVNIMSSTLVPTAVFWPSRVELRKNLPAAQHSPHPDCAVIIDFFTVPFEEPISQVTKPQVVPQSQTCNMLKYLIGGAPQGVVTFVSRGVLGNVSDKSLAEGCGFLCKLLPERVISTVKQRYSMLTGPVESPFTTATDRTSNLRTFDKIVQVACALNNLCISAAPLG